MELNFNDFEKQDVSFDINELQKAYKEILEIKDFSGPDGVSNFGAISEFVGGVSSIHNLKALRDANGKIKIDELLGSL